MRLKGTKELIFIDSDWTLYAVEENSLSLLSRVFPAAPAAAPIADPEVVKRDYAYWRIRIFYSIFFGYASYYLTRLSFNTIMPTMMKDLGLDYEQLGIVLSAFALSYGASKFVSGILADRANARYFLPFGLIATGVCNILFGLSSSLYMFAITWGMNAWFQGFGATPCARLLTYWYSRSERGSWWSYWNISHNVGGLTILIFAGFLAQHLGWRCAMYIPGAICIAMGFFLINRLRDTPTSLGLPPVEVYRGEESVAVAKAKEGEDLSAWQILYQYVLKNKWIWLLAITNIFVYFIRGAFSSWMGVYSVQMKGYSQWSSSVCCSMFEIGGLCGSLTAGWASDKLFQARRSPIIILFATGIALGVLFIWWLPPGTAWLDFTAIFMIGFMVFGPQMLVGMAATELAHKKAAATTTGFVGWFAYVGSAASGWPLGMITKRYGWEGFFVTTLICAAICVCLLLPLLVAEKPVCHQEPKHNEPQPA